MKPSLTRLIIVGGGNSISEGIKLGLWDKLKYEYTFGINSAIYFMKPTVPVWGDWWFYKENKKELDKYPLTIGMFDGKIGNGKFHKCQKNANLIMLNTNNKYHGVDSWEKGFYSRALSGLFSLTLGIALGFKEIYLLGFDFGEINNKTHFYQAKTLEKQKIGKSYKNGHLQCGIGKDSNGNYRTGVYNNNVNQYFNVYKQVSPQITIYNVSLLSKINTFEKISYNEFFKNLEQKQIQVLQNKASLETVDLIEKFRKPFV